GRLGGRSRPHRAGGRRPARARSQARGPEATARLDLRSEGTGRGPGAGGGRRGAATARMRAIGGGMIIAARALRRESGQAVGLAVRGSVAFVAGALALVAIAGAVTGKGRAQRAADLAAISAARSMRDDLPRLLSPPRLPSGLPDPRHLEKLAYLARARTAALEAARANGVGTGRLRLSFPDRDSFAP